MGSDALSGWMVAEVSCRASAGVRELLGEQEDKRRRSVGGGWGPLLHNIGIESKSTLSGITDRMCWAFPTPGRTYTQAGTGHHHSASCDVYDGTSTEKAVVKGEFHVRY